MPDNKLNKHKYGFYQLKTIPSSTEMENIYKNEYYQNHNKYIAYSQSYTTDELEYFNNRAMVANKIYYNFSNKSEGSFLDIGCGEGFISKYFYDEGWQVSLIDFSKYGIETFNKELLDFFTQGDAYDILDKLYAQNKKYDYINLDHILFTLVDPILLLEKVKKIMHKDSLFRVVAGNDFSDFATFMKNNNFVDDDYIVSSGTINYFNFDNLENTLTSLEFKVFFKHANFPVESYILNEHSNFYKNKDLGKAAHNARVLIENYLVKKNIDEYIKYMESAAKLDYGRLAMFYVTL